jgi:hypothetical protein
VFRRPIGDRKSRLVGQIDSRHFELELEFGELVAAGIYWDVPDQQRT